MENVEAWSQKSRAMLPPTADPLDERRRSVERSRG
jgi:hypothetical protein